MISAIDLNRIVIHKIIGGTPAQEAFIDAADGLHTLNDETSTTLKMRIFNAVSKSRRFFETEVEKTGDGSFWELAKQLPESDDEQFLSLSIQIADLAASSQTARVPGGLLLILDAVIDKKPGVIVIKAELQEAMSLTGNVIKILTDLFLSPAKDFYKIGILVHEKPSVSNHNAYRCWVYDNQFSSDKRDLAVYFYSRFLGFSTSSNDKLQTKRFFETFNEFVTNNVDHKGDMSQLKVAMKTELKHSTTTTIDPAEFSKYFLDNPQLEKAYRSEVLGKFPNPFTKDLILLDHTLGKSSLSVANGIKLTGDADALEGRVDILNGAQPKDIIENIELGLESGAIKSIITIAAVRQPNRFLPSDPEDE